MIPLQGGNLTNASSGFASSGELGGTVIVLMLVVVAVALLIVGSTTVYRWMLNATGYFARSVEYALKGVVTAIFIGIFAGPIYLLSQLDAETKGLIGYAIAAVIGGYIALVVLGMIGDTVWQLIKRRHVEATGHEPFEHWGGDKDLKDAND